MDAQTAPTSQEVSKSDQTSTNQSQQTSAPNGSADDLLAEIERLNRELVAAQQERSQSAAYGLDLLNKTENLQRKYESIESAYEQSKRDLQELREAWSKAVTEQRVSATTVFEKEVQLLNDSDALAASFTVAKQEIEKELKQTKSQLDSAIAEKDRYLNERDELTKKVSQLELERKNLRIELKDVKGRETRLFNENSELEEENVSLQKQVSNLRSTQVEFESSKHEIQRLQDEVAGLNSQLEEMVTLRRITERQMQEALEALQSEREQKYALRKELDKRNSADPIINWTSLAALKGSPHLANIAFRGLGSSHRSSAHNDLDDGSPNGGSDLEGGATFSDADPSYDIINELEMPSIEGSLFDEVHLTEIKKLQQNLDEKENQRSNLNTKLIEIQHKLDSKSRQADEIEKKLSTICSLVEEIYSKADLQKVNLAAKKFEAAKQQQVNPNSSDESPANSAQVSSTTNENQPSATVAAAPTSTPKNVLDDFENVYSHLQTLFAEFRAYQEMLASAKETVQTKKDASLPGEINSIDHVILEADKKIEANETLQSDDVLSLRAMLYKKLEQVKQMRTILKSNKESAEVALMNLKSKYDMEKAIVAETMAKLKMDHKKLKEDAATFASLRTHFAARIEEYNTEIEKLQSKLVASEQEKNTLNSILRMAIEQKVILTQKLEALEMDREDPHMSSTPNSGYKGANGQQPRSGVIRSRGAFNRGARTPRGGPGRAGLNERR